MERSVDGDGDGRDGGVVDGKGMVVGRWIGAAGRQPVPIQIVEALDYADYYCLQHSAITMLQF